MIRWQSLPIYTGIVGVISVGIWLPLTTVSLGPTAFLDDTERAQFQRLVGKSALWARISTRLLPQWQQPHPSIQSIHYQFPNWVLLQLLIFLMQEVFFQKVLLQKVWRSFVSLSFH